MASSQTGSPQKLAKGKPKTYATCFLYNQKSAEQKLRGLTLAACNPDTEKADTGGDTAAKDNVTTEPVTERLQPVMSDKMSCNYCDTTFTTRLEQKRHYRSDWHRYNLKQRLKGRNSVTEDQFEIISGNISSISGSDTDSDMSESESGASGSGQETRPRGRKPLGVLAQLRNSECSSSTESEDEGRSALDLAARRLPKVYFRNVDGDLISLYRCVIYHKKDRPAQQSDLIAMATEVPNHMTWAVFMSGGGHFAAAVFDREKLLVHKTFHRYVVRAKRGTAQGSRDSQGNAPKSAGASLRRYNEAALTQEIQELIASWDKELAACDKIFLRAPSFNRRIFFSGKSPPFKKDDARIRYIPFQTKRPTFNEVRRVYEMLASIECYGEEADIQDFIPISPPQVFNPETGQLAIREESQTSPRHRKYKNKKFSPSPLATGEVQASKEDDDKVQGSAGDGSETMFSSEPVTKSDDKEPVHRGSALPEHILEDVTIPTSSTTSTASESELVEVMESINLMELKEYAGTRKPKRRKKKRKQSLRRQKEPESDVQEEEKYHLKNSLYTACKVGDLDSLNNLLAIFTVDTALYQGQSDTPNQSQTDQSGTPLSHDQSHDQSHDKGYESHEKHGDPVTSLEEVMEVTASETLTNSKEVEVLDTEKDENSEANQTNLFDDSKTQPEEEKEEFSEKNMPDNDSKPNISLSEVENSDNLTRPVEQNITSATVIDKDENCTLEMTSVPSYLPLERTPVEDSQRDQAGQSAPPSNTNNTQPAVVGSLPDMSPVVTAAILNETFGDNDTTLLHVAARAGNKDIIPILMGAGADPTIRDKGGLTPYMVSSDKPTRNAFRKFISDQPDKYDYEKAQIPAPLSEERETEKKKKEAEKRKAMKKSRQEKQKVKREEELKKAAEEREKQRYLGLSDREKRAMAAEKRLVAQADREGAPKPVLLRCFQCGEDMTGKVPFEYMEFKFCASKCLQQHRKKKSAR